MKAFDDCFVMATAPCPQFKIGFLIYIILSNTITTMFRFDETLCHIINIILKWSNKGSIPLEYVACVPPEARTALLWLWLKSARIWCVRPLPLRLLLLTSCATCVSVTCLWTLWWLKEVSAIIFNISLLYILSIKITWDGVMRMPCHYGRALTFQEKTLWL